MFAQLDVLVTIPIDDRHGLRHDTLSIAEAARRLRGLVQPRFIPLGDILVLSSNLIATKL
jgi:hypothetical protein